MEFHLSDSLNFLSLGVVTYMMYLVSALRREVRDLTDLIVTMKNDESRRSEKDLNMRLEELQTMRFSPLRIVSRNQ